MLVFLVFIIHVSVNGLDSTSEFYSCLTWQIKGYNFELICRVSDIKYPFYFLDTDKKVVGSCSKNEQVCRSSHEHGIIEINLKTNEVILTIKEIQQNYLNGIWTCVNGKNDLQTAVSTSKGIASATDIFIKGDIISAYQVQVTCFSCRQPYRNNVEFLVDDESIDSITFIRETNACLNGIGVSHPDIFTCSGTIFVYKFAIHNKSTSIHYSCDMRFVDTALSSRFQKKATLYFDGKGFYYNGSKSEITKLADSSIIDRKHRDDNNNFSSTTPRAHSVGNSEKSGGRVYVWILAIVFTAIILIGITSPLFYCLNRKHGKREKKKNSKETKCLLSLKEISEYQQQIKMSGSIKDDVNNESKVAPEVKLVVSDKICGPCKRRETIISKATIWCFDCVEAFCFTCINYHSSLDITNGHCVRDINELPEIFDIPFICSIHNKSKLEYFCVSHYKVCCKMCVDEKHIDCDAVERVELILHTLQYLPEEYDCTERLSGMLETLRNVLESYHYNLRDIEKDAEQITLQICNFYEKTYSDIDILSPDIENKIHRNKTILISNLEEKKKKCISDIKGKIFELESFIKISNDHKNLLNIILENASEKNSFLVTQYVDSVLEDSEKKLENLVQNKICIRLCYTEYQEDPLKSFGDIDIGKREPEKFSLRHISLRESQMPITKEHVSLKLLNCFHLRDISKMHAGGIAVSAGGLITFCDRGHPQIIVCNGTGDKQTPVDVKYQPWEIDSIPYTDIIAISCTFHDFILFVDAFKRTCVDKIEIKGSAQCCVACTNKYIITGSRKMNKIDIFELKGSTAQYLLTVDVDTNLSLISLSFNENSETIYFISMESDRLHRVDMQGNDLPPFETTEKGMQTTTNLKCIRADEKRNVYFLDSVRNNVHILSEKGKNLGVLVLGEKVKNAIAFTFNNDYTKLYLVGENEGRPFISEFSTTD